jgi:predicted SAM-dependent methyltransferase
MSETSKRRAVLAPYCQGLGIDIGYGGDPITPTAICIDLPQPYTRVGNHPQHAATTNGEVDWIMPGSLDYVYSSHLIEDFDAANQIRLVTHWLSLLRQRGNLVILSVDQSAYEADCRANGTAPNEHHQIPDYSLQWFIDHVLTRVRQPVYILHSAPLVAGYSWEAVLSKQGASVDR